MYLLGHPLYALRLLINTIYYNGYSFISSTVCSPLGLVDTHMGNMVIMGYLFLLGYVVAKNRISKYAEMNTQVLALRYGVIVCSIITFIGVLLVMYTWTFVHYQSSLSNYIIWFEIILDVIVILQLFMSYAAWETLLVWKNVQKPYWKS